MKYYDYVGPIIYVNNESCLTEFDEELLNCGNLIECSNFITISNCFSSNNYIWRVGSNVYLDNSIYLLNKANIKIEMKQFKEKYKKEINFIKKSFSSKLLFEFAYLNMYW